jgi:hypothetical protein
MNTEQSTNQLAESSDSASQDASRVSQATNAHMHPASLPQPERDEDGDLDPIQLAPDSDRPTDALDEYETSPVNDDLFALADLPAYGEPGNQYRSGPEQANQYAGGTNPTNAGTDPITNPGDDDLSNARTTETGGVRPDHSDQIIQENGMHITENP